jgi:hypothetical protein
MVMMAPVCIPDLVALAKRVWPTHAKNQIHVKREDIKWRNRTY